MFADILITLEVAELNLELYRLIISQAAERYAHKATSTVEYAKYLDEMLESTKPKLLYLEWDILIATPFRYPTPVAPEYKARFRPPHFAYNVFYGSFSEITAAFEASFHFLKQRVHLDHLEESGIRTLFVADADTKNTFDVRSLKNVNKIMDRNSYEESYKIALKYSKKSDGILYPSCRAPEKGGCVAMYNIKCFDKDVKREWNIHFEFNSSTQTVHWYRKNILELNVDWKSVH